MPPPPPPQSPRQRGARTCLLDRQAWRFFGQIGFRRVGVPLSETERLSGVLQPRARLDLTGVRQASLGPNCCGASPPACVSGGPNFKHLSRLAPRGMSLKLPGRGHARWSCGQSCVGSGPRQSLVYQLLPLGSRGECGAAWVGDREVCLLDGGLVRRPSLGSRAGMFGRRGRGGAVEPLQGVCPPARAQASLAS